MLRFILAFSLVLGVACMGGKEPSSDPPDSDGGNGRAFEGDDAGECGDGADNDRDGLFDCDDADCDGSPACEEAEDSSAPTVTYDVILDGVVGVGGNFVECIGESTFVADWESGTLEGPLGCRLAEGDQSVTGDFEGGIGGSAFDGIWRAQAGPAAMEVLIGGDAGYTFLEADVLFSGMVTFEGTLYGEAR